MSFDIAESPPSFESSSADDNGAAEPCDLEQVFETEGGIEKEDIDVNSIKENLNEAPLSAPAGNPVQPAAAAIQVG